MDPQESRLDVEAFTASLERVVERLGDPAGQVYARLFALSPDLESMFALDRDGAARGEMLRLCFDALIDLCGEGHYARGLFSTELQNHGMWGVTSQQFQSFFTTVRDVVREANGSEWTAAAEAAWQSVLGRVDGLIHPDTARSGAPD